jgi:hypothetical protein
VDQITRAVYSRCRALNKYFFGGWWRCFQASLGHPVIRTHAAAIHTTLYPAGVKTVAACAFATNPLQQIVAPLGYPADWKIIVACTDGEWREITRHFDVTTSESAFTICDAKVTVINARIFRERI